MTQRVARPMKFAAFISIIASLAFILGACQGAVGPTGPQGPPGSQGPPGPSGGTPDNAVDAFVALSTARLAELGLNPILINDAPPLPGATNGQLGTVPTGLNAANYFRGGYPPITYARGAAPAAVATTDVFTVAIAADGAITITPKKDTADASKLLANTRGTGGTQFTDDHLYVNGTLFSIAATDDVGTRLMIGGVDGNTDGDFLDPGESVAIKMNRAPRAGELAIPAIIVGTQSVFAIAATAAQKADVCNQLNTHCPVDGSTPPMPSYIVGGLVADSANRHFVDEDAEYLIFKADPATGDAAYVGAEVTVKVNPDGTKQQRLRITGLQGGGTAAAPARKAAVVHLTATDLGGLTTSLANTRAINVTVDPAPALASSRTLPTAVTKKRGTEATVTILENVALFFTDDSTADDTDATSPNADGRTLAITAVVAKAADDPQGVVETTVTNLINSDGDLEITPANNGTVTVTIRATETGTGAAGQYIEHTLAVTITD